MTPALLEIFCHAQGLISEREGMLAMNQYREAHVEAPTYSEEHFLALQSQFESLADRCKELEPK
jgi:hypothetical protein